MLRKEYETLPGAKKKEDKKEKAIQNDRKSKRGLRAERAFVKALRKKLANIEDQLHQANSKVQQRLENGKTESKDNEIID